MSDLRALIRVKEKELRCLEWSLMAQKAQEAAGALVPENLREELEDCRSEQQVGQSPPAAAWTSSSSFSNDKESRWNEQEGAEQDSGLLWWTRFKSGCPTWEITLLPKQNPSRPRGIFWFCKVFCWDVLPPQHRFTPLPLSDESEPNTYRYRTSDELRFGDICPFGLWKNDLKFRACFFLSHKVCFK